MRGSEADMEVMNKWKQREGIGKQEEWKPSSNSPACAQERTEASVRGTWCAQWAFRVTRQA